MQILAILLFSLSFEERSADLFRVRLQGSAATFHPDRVSIGPVTLRFPGASLKPRLEGVGAPSPSTYIGRDLTRMFQQYPKLAMRGLYPGVDAIFYGNGGHLEYDLSLAPGASLRRVRLTFDGGRSLRIDGHGNLNIDTAGGVLEQKLPRVFQSNGRRVSARYVLLSGNEVGIRLGPYDARSTLTIDPELVYTKYFGGSGSDTASAIATDAQGNIYVTGSSNSVDFPTTSGLQPKANPPLIALSNSGKTVTPVPVGSEDSVEAIGGTADGTILYAVTPGGVFLSSDSGSDWVQGAPLLPASAIGDISVDAISPSTVLIATSAGLQFTSQAGEGWYLHETDLPVGPSGSVNASQVFISPVNHLICYAVTANPSGLFKATDAGNTWLPLNPTSPGEPAVPVPPYSLPIVAALGPNGTDIYVIDANAILLKSTDGGATWQKVAQGLYGSTAMAFDPTNPSNLYVLASVGLLKSVDGGVTYTTVVANKNPNASQGLTIKSFALEPATGAVYIGAQDSVYVVPSGGTPQIIPQLSHVNLHALAALGSRVYAAIDSPSRPFVMKLDPTGSQILYSTFFGSGESDSIDALQVDAQGNAVVVGITSSPDFPVSAQLSPAAPTGQFGGFVVKLNASGTGLVYSSVLGASSQGLFVQALALDSAGAAYITGRASPGFPTTPNAVQPGFPTAACTRPSEPPFINTSSGMNAFVSKISADGSALVYSTFLGGSCGSDGLSLSVDSAGEAIVGGATTSPDFQTTPNTYQPAFPGQPGSINAPNALSVGFLTKLSAAGDKLIASSYLGGGYETSANGVALDAAGNVYVTGFSNGITPGATPGAFQTTIASNCVPTLSIGPSPPPTPAGAAFVLKLDPTLATARYLTYLGGSCGSSGSALAVDASGDAWVLGGTGSPDFPLLAPFEEGGHAFISELNPSGSQLLFSSSADADSMALDPAGAVLLAGSGSSSTVAKQVQQFGGFGSSVAVSKIDPGTSPPVEIDSIVAVNGFPPAIVVPFTQTIAPGQLIQITGRNLGPATQVNAQLDSTGRLPDVVGTTSVRFDDIPAPLISVQDGMIVCFAPFEISKTTQVTVTNGGQVSNSVRIPVFNSNPEILTIVNQDGTVNSAQHPAAVGSVISIYVAGLGATTPPSLDGLVNSAPLPVPMGGVSVNFTGPAVLAQFAAAAPGLIAGITQVNVQIPGGVAATSSIRIGNGMATLYVSK